MKKNILSVYLNEEDETKAITISTYAQYGDGAFAISADATKYSSSDSKTDTTSSQ